ncbi:MAG: ROK family transcriptional regulator [Ruthenibacterium sp.]
MDTPRASTTMALRQNNRNRIFRAIYQAETALAKQELAAMLHMSLPTITQNLTELMTLGVIAYDGTLDSTGGRKAKAIVLAENARTAIGISLSRNHARFIATNLRAKELAYKTIAFSFSNTPDFSRELAVALETFLDENALPREMLLGVGITIPGIVNATTNLVEFAPTLQTSGIPLATFQQAIPYPVYVENDANAGGFAEWWGGCNSSSMAYLSVEKGVGGCVLMNGQTYQGNHNRSGEFGHICIEPHGKACSCGQRGCLEAYCSTDRLSYDLGISLETFFTQLSAENSDFYAIWDTYLDHLALGVNTIRMVLDSSVVLGGVLAQYIEPYLGVLQKKALALNSFCDAAPYVQLCRYRSKSTCMGAALHFIAQYVESLS